MSHFKTEFSYLADTSNSSIEYAARRPWHRRITGKWCTVAAIVVATFIASVAWGELAWLKLQLLYCQTRCMSHAAPATQVIALRQVHPQWQRFGELLSPPGPQPAGTVYLHERVSPGGNRRLVAVNLHGPGGRGRQFALPRVVVPGGLFSHPREVPCQESLLIPEGGGIRVYAGQSDAQNAAHFTFVIDTDRRQHVVDGWLRDDDTVKLEPRTRLD